MAPPTVAKLPQIIAFLRDIFGGLNRAAAELSQVPLLAEDLPGQNHLFPTGHLDRDLQQLDLRERNSWRLLMAEVSPVELLEVQLEGKKRMTAAAFLNGFTLNAGEVLA